jgi:hypothetical protein
VKILIACFPKSGSTFLCTLISNLPKFSLQSFVPAFDRREQELCETLLQRLDGVERPVAQHHVRASAPTLRLIDKYEITPIVLVRNIYDAAVSVADHLANESPISPMAYFDERITHRPLGERIKATIDLAIPWYINFYVSWSYARPNAIVTYEDLILGGPERQASYLRSIGVETDINEVAAVYEKLRGQDTRFNVGRPGRGAEFVDNYCRKHVERLASYYPDVDFSLIGIKKPGGILKMISSNDPKRGLSCPLVP